MKFSRAGRFSLAIALALAAAFAAPSAFARKPQPPPVVYVPPPPPPMPGVGLGSRFLQDAGAYEGYMRDAAAVSPAFVDPTSVAGALKVGAAYDPGELRRGAVAYGAIAALGDAAFVADVRRNGQTPEARYAIIARIYANPANVLTFRDAPVAAGLAKNALAQAGMRVLRSGDAVRLAAYGIQHQPWSLTEVAGREQRASAVKTLSASRRLVSPDDTAALARLVEGDAPPGMAPDPAAPPYSPLVIRAVALAALAAVGQASDADVAHLGWISDDYYMDHCLAEAKLSLYECLAVARPNYEDVFCLGQHALKDTGACVVKAAGSTVPLEVNTRAIPVPPLHSAARRRRKA
jgi:hypothetical protein